MAWRFGGYLCVFQILGSLNIFLYKAVFLCYWIPSFLLVGEGRRKYEIQQCTKGISNVCQNCSAPILKKQIMDFISHKIPACRIPAEPVKGKEKKT